MKILYKNKHWKLNEEYNTDKILYLLIDRPTYINDFNDKFYISSVSSKYYDLPHFIDNDDNLFWPERKNKNYPDVIWHFGEKEYAID